MKNIRHQQLMSTSMSQSPNKFEESRISSLRQHHNMSSTSIHSQILVGSSFNTSKVDFRNPYLKKVSTFGSSQFGKINKKVFMREYKGEFIGNYSPPATKYNVNQSDFHTEKFVSKTQPRDMRICPMVSKHQLSMPNVSPQAYLGTADFIKQNKASSFFGSRAARNIDVR